MSQGAQEAPNPYVSHPELMRDRLSNPLINQAEHGRYWPELQCLLPRFPSRVRRVLDFGCGPGYFTEQLAAKYPRAEIVGVDAVPAMLPLSPSAQPSRPNTAYRVWDGQTPLGDRPFDLIVGKLVFHYLTDEAYRLAAKHLVGALAPGGRIVTSMPAAAIDPRTGRRFLETKDTVQVVGGTGLQSRMHMRSLWSDAFAAHLPEGYFIVQDTVRDSHDVPKRQNIAYLPERPALRLMSQLNRRRGTPSDLSRRLRRKLMHDLMEDYRASCQIMPDTAGGA